MAICPNCNVYAVHPDSLKGWCKKCTGVLTGQVLKSMCMVCGLKYADERSGHDFCYKCHFDMTDELLDQPSGSRIEEPQPDPANDPEAEYWGYSIYDDDDEEIPDAFDWEYEWRCPDCGDEDCAGDCYGVYDGP